MTENYTHNKGDVSMTPTRFMARQGDVLIVAMNNNDRAEGMAPVPRDKGRLVLAYGEVTGHAHVVEGPAELFTTEDRDDLERRFLAVENEGATVVHEEHDTITLPPGFYEVRRQREYSPDAIRNVAD